jgi:hypothetical protein
VPEGSDNDEYTAVVFFHGMGSQRRYESVSQLVDSLDAYINYRGGGSLEPRDANVVFERVDNVSPRMAHLETEYRSPDDTGHYARNARFYEVYWAPIAAQAPTLYETLAWLFKQILVPFRTLATPWRDRERLHRAILLRMWDEAKRDKAFSEKHFVELSRLYEDFARRDPKPEASTFADFRSFIKKNAEAELEDLNKIEDLCVRWRYRYIREQLMALAIVTTVLLYLAFVLLLFAGALYSASEILPVPFLDSVVSAINLDGPVNSVYERLPNRLQDIFIQPWVKWLSVLLALASFIVIRFFRHYLGDVLQWVTYEETDVKNQKRREILNLGFDTLFHVLSSEKCKQLVVVGHSLGSAIAMDSLLELRRYNLTKPPPGDHQPLSFDKLTDFITFGSPIDRIHYFFESYRVKKGKRYGSVVEKVRGDLGTEPFRGCPPVRWVNVHDRSDIISSALHTPNATPDDRILAVENVKTGSHLFPLLPVAHGSYFQSHVALGFIFEAVFGDRPVLGRRPHLRIEGAVRDALNTGWRAKLFAVIALLAIAGLRLLFGSKSNHSAAPPSYPLEGQPAGRGRETEKWSMVVSEAMTYIGVAWIWLLLGLVLALYISSNFLITLLFMLLLVSTVLLIVGFVASALFGHLESVYRKS